MRKLFKTSIFAISALALPLSLAATVNAEALIKDSIDTTLEYQVNSSQNSMRFISTMVLNNNTTLDDITKIDMDFKLTKSGEEDKNSKTVTKTTVYEAISGENGKPKADDTYYAVFTITDLDQVEGWKITPTFTYIYADSSSEVVTASSWLIGGKRQYFVQQYTDWGTDLYYYMFGADGNNVWPGEKMTLQDAENHIYSFDYLPSSNYTTIIFNNGDFEGHEQTANMPVSSEYNYYVQQDANAFAHPTAGHDGVAGHDANGHWSCSTCKYDYEAHTLTGVTNGTTRTITCSECGYSVSFDTTTMYVTRNWNDWTNLHVYSWYNNGENDVELTSWPGTAMTFDHTNENNEEVYRVTIPSNAEWIIINNGGNGKQTVNIRLSDYEDYNAFYFVWKDEKDQVGAYLYIPE